MAAMLSGLDGPESVAILERRNKMGYRLDVYKNSVSQENNIYYGTKLIGYCGNFS